MSAARDAASREGDLAVPAYLLVRVTGPLDAVSAAEMPDRVRAVTDAHAHVVLDLTGVGVLGAAGVSALVHVHQSLAREGRRMQVLVPGGATGGRLLGAVHAVETLEVQPTLEAAVGPDAGVPQVIDLRTGDEDVASPTEAQQAALDLELLTVSSWREVRPTLLQLSRLAARAVPGAEEASVTLGSPQKPDLVATSSVVAQAADGAQFTAGRGPTVDAFRDDVPVLSQDAGADPRWPALADAIGRSGVNVRAALAIPLHTPARRLPPIGVLTLYAADGEALATPATGQAAERVAARAAGLLREAGLIEQVEQIRGQMQQALSSRAQIDQAKGIVMQELGCDADRAFDVLRAISSHEGRKVRDVAREIVEGARSARRNSDPGIRF